MKNKELKKIMTDLAAGHISQKEADTLIKEIKVSQKNPEEKSKEKILHKKKKEKQNER